MKPLADLTDAALRRVALELTDIDDTLTEDGRLKAAAYQALERLQQAGLKVVPVTGRPAGWCDLIARFWPVDGVVGENGAFYFRYDRAARRMIRRHALSAQARAANREKLAVIGARILAAVPGTAYAADQAWRDADIAVDFAEDVPKLPNEAVARIADLARGEGAVAKISSIHVNVWIGDWDKLGMTKLLAREQFGLDLDADPERAVFSGDSPNDEPMFRHFPLAVGVANIKEFEGRLTHPPAYVTARRGGAGFAELANRLLDAHGFDRSGGRNARDAARRPIGRDGGRPRQPERRD
jgi:hypothetical protein